MKSCPLGVMASFAATLRILHAETKLKGVLVILPVLPNPMLGLENENK
jgi:hypothetical protein